MQCHFSSLFTLTISSFNYHYKWNLFSSASKTHIHQWSPISLCLSNSPYPFPGRKPSHTYTSLFKIYEKWYKFSLSLCDWVAIFSSAYYTLDIKIFGTKCRSLCESLQMFEVGGSTWNLYSCIPHTTCTVDHTQLFPSKSRSLTVTGGCGQCLQDCSQKAEAIAKNAYRKSWQEALEYIIQLNDNTSHCIHYNINTKS